MPPAPQEALWGLLQQAAVESLHNRAGTLIFASSFASSLLGSRALADGLGAWEETAPAASSAPRCIAGGAGAGGGRPQHRQIAQARSHPRGLSTAVAPVHRTGSGPIYEGWLRRARDRPHSPGPGAGGGLLAIWSAEAIRRSR
jgi:hypothetical protein